MRFINVLEIKFALKATVLVFINADKIVLHVFSPKKEKKVIKTVSVSHIKTIWLLVPKRWFILYKNALTFRLNGYLSYDIKESQK